ncbi:hypothetical protein Hdeb2414_s0024g00644861 [Helianthus debilis subsp. tardiflorus]
MRDSKLKINIAKFAIENADAKGVPVGNDHIPKPAVSGVNAKVFGVSDFRSYSDVVGSRRMGGDGSRGGGSNQVLDKQEEEKSVVVPDRKVAFNELRGLAVVGRTVDLEPMVDFDRLLQLLKLVDADSFFNSRKVWEPWFTKVDVWNGQSLPMERVACLKVFGVLLHLFDSEVLEMVGGMFGKVLHVQKSLLKEKDLSVTRVAVLAGEAMRIREAVKVLC